MKTRLTIACSLLLNVCFSQHAGNQVYEGNNTYNNGPSNNRVRNEMADKIIANGNQITYKINILDNAMADSYIITFGLNQEALTPKDCNIEINKRITGFRSELKKLGVASEDIYTDFISQTRIYDYKSDAKGTRIEMTQEAKGFEIKKNLIVKIKKLSLFDQLIETASEFEIFNIVKVDYFNNDSQKIYDQMLSEANKILDQRTQSNKTIKDPDYYSKPQVSINYYSIQPGNQYKQYTAYESSDVSYYDNYNSNTVFVKQEQRKSKTFFYDSLQPDFYDKVIDADTPVVGLQYIMEMTVTYTHR